MNESIPQRGETGNMITTVLCLITYIYYGLLNDKLNYKNEYYEN